jgi:hypothetical protein
MFTKIETLNMLQEATESDERSQLFAEDILLNDLARFIHT